MRFLTIIVSVFVLTSTAYAQDPTHMHKDEYMSFCMSKRDSEAYCKCTMKAVDLDVAKRKANMEKILNNKSAQQEKRYKNTVKFFLKKRLAKNEDEIQADCEVMRGHADGKVSEEEFTKLFSGRKGGVYKTRMERNICFQGGAKVAEKYKNKEYEYINASYIMTGDNACHRKHLSQ